MVCRRETRHLVEATYRFGVVAMCHDCAHATTEWWHGHRSADVEIAA